jgi:hypothetical protein
MGGKRQRTNIKGVGSATDSSSRARRDRGALDVRGVNQKINQDDFFQELDLLVGKGREQGGCSVGNLVSRLDEPIAKKLTDIMKNPNVNSSRLSEVMASFGIEVSSTDVLRRHRRRLQGKDGCKCQSES